jgi:hypothetical protein
MRSRYSYTILTIVVLFILFGPAPPSPRPVYSPSRGANAANALAKFKHQGPGCSVSSADLYEQRGEVCANRTSMLEAMSSGGRIGRDSPYTARGCDMIWYSTKEVCEILGRFSQVMVIGDSMLRHIMGALNILIREDLGYGAVTDWNFNREERSVAGVPSLDSARWYADLSLDAIASV